MGRLDGKAVIVTGASRGIGAEIARTFAAEGGRVACAARTLREGDHPLEGSLERTVEEIRAAGGEATPVAVNISEPQECERLVKAAREAYGPVDVLVNNAALTYFLPVKDYPLNRWMRSWAVNFHAPFILCQLVLGDMIPRRLHQLPALLRLGDVHRHRRRLTAGGPDLIDRSLQGALQRVVALPQGARGADHAAPLRSERARDLRADAAAGTRDDH